MPTMLRPDAPAKCCSYCGGRDHNYEDCPKRKSDAERQKDAPGNAYQPGAAAGGEIRQPA
ncbi:hypothetical protein NKI56_08560 [Mesorhizobium sp. M0622]|uniref:hypothetical protein n=1 Tax=unclassified Mesorhizobium TaxID=325217 RepID=UPI0033394279